MKPASFVPQPTSRSNRARPSAPPEPAAAAALTHEEGREPEPLSELRVEPLTPPGGEWLNPVCAWFSLALPLGLALLRSSAGAQWRGDMALVRSVGMVPIGLEGALSSVLAQLMSLLPIGGRHLRVALVSARDGDGVDELVEIIDAHRAFLERSEKLGTARSEQAAAWAEKRLLVEFGRYGVERLGGRVALAAQLSHSKRTAFAELETLRARVLGALGTSTTTTRGDPTLDTFSDDSDDHEHEKTREA